MHGYSIVTLAEATAADAPATTSTQEQPADSAGGQKPPPPGFLGFMPIILLFVVMYLLIIRPQQKRQKEHREMVSRLKTGDRVVTNGGIYGTIVGIKEASVNVEIASGVEIEVIRSAVNAVVTEKDAAGKSGRA
jgi:preprotein translocase subunit YajC